MPRWIQKRKMRAKNTLISQSYKWSIRTANMKQKPKGFYEAVASPPRSEAHKLFRKPQACFMRRSHASFFMHRRCASLRIFGKIRASWFVSRVLYSFEPQSSIFALRYRKAQRQSLLPPFRHRRAAVCQSTLKGVASDRVYRGSMLP